MKKSIISLLFFFAVCAFSSNMVFAQPQDKPIMGIDANSLDFGKVIIGTTRSLSFKIENAATLPCKLLFSWDPIILPFSISPAITIHELLSRNQREFIITFKPTAAISYNQNIRLTNNANVVLVYLSAQTYPNGYPQFIVSFKGSGITGAVVNPRQISEKK